MKKRCLRHEPLLGRERGKPLKKDACACALARVIGPSGISSGSALHSLAFPPSDGDTPSPISWINVSRSQLCAPWLTDCGARRRCQTYPQLRMVYTSLDSRTRRPGIVFWIRVHGIWQGDPSYYVHGILAWICLTSSYGLSQFGSSSTIFPWNIGQAHVLGTSQVLFVFRSTLIHLLRTRQSYPLLGYV